MSYFKDLMGKKFSRLKVIKKKGKQNSHALWIVECDCGYRFDIPATNLVSGNTTKCKKCKARAQRKLSDEDINDMINSRSRGISIASIAADYEVSRSTVHRNTVGLF